MYSLNDTFRCVSTFGNLRIEAYLQLPAAYRSLSRPSSAPDAKAFTLCSFSLELPLFSCLSSHIIYLQWKSIFTLFISWIRLSFDMRPNCSFPRFSKRPWFFWSQFLFLNPVKLSVRFSYLVFNEHSFVSVMWKFWISPSFSHTGFRLLSSSRVFLTLSLASKICRLVGSMWTTPLELSLSLSFHIQSFAVPISRFGFGGLKWSRTTDLMLIRHAL